MSLHPSLKQGGQKGFVRTVLKRSERIKWMMKKGIWSEERSIFGLPKIKIVKMKVTKKEKKQEETKKPEGEKKEG